MEAVKYKVLNTSGAEVGSMELDGDVFNVEINAALVYDTVRWQRARRRAGTHSSLTKGMMKGGNRKPWKQKGTGRARCGSNTSPLWVGGGRAHGPQPHKYDFRLSKRARKQALCSVLSDKVKSGTLVILDNLAVKTGKTKEMLGILKALKLTAKKAAVILPEKDPMVWREANNIPNVLTLPVTGVNVYDLIRHKYVVSTKAGVAALAKRILAEGVAA